MTVSAQTTKIFLALILTVIRILTEGLVSCVQILYNWHFLVCDEAWSTVLYFLTETSSAFGHICFKAQNATDIYGSLPKDLSGKLVFNVEAQLIWS